MHAGDRSQGVVERRVSRSGRCGCKLLSVSQAHEKGGREESNEKQTAWPPGRHPLPWRSGSGSSLPRWCSLAGLGVTRSATSFQFVLKCHLPTEAHLKSQRSFLPLHFVHVLPSISTILCNFHFFIVHCLLHEAIYSVQQKSFLSVLYTNISSHTQNSEWHVVLLENHVVN